MKRGPVIWFCVNALLACALLSIVVFRYDHNKSYDAVLGDPGLKLVDKEFIELHATRHYSEGFNNGMTYAMQVIRGKRKVGDYTGMRNPYARSSKESP